MHQLTHFNSKRRNLIKELDFKIRKQVKNYGLYQGTSKYGKIIINLKDEKVIDLSDKLEFERMGDVLNSKDIRGIAVTINQI